MLVQNSVYRNTYLTDGVNKDFYFSFPILEASQVLVQTSLLTDTGTVTTVDPSQYTVTGVGLTTGGRISFNTAPPTGSRIALTLNIPITQLYQYAELDSFPAKSHEDALAKLTLICQQLKEQLERAVRLPATSSETPQEVLEDVYSARDRAEIAAANTLEWLNEVGTEVATNSHITAANTTTARTLANRFADTINVKDFGAVGDGVTDDTAAIAAWITYIMETGKKGFVPAGIYCMASALTITMSGNIDIEASDGAVFKGTHEIRSVMILFLAETRNEYHMSWRGGSFDLSNTFFEEAALSGSGLGIQKIWKTIIDGVRFIGKTDTPDVGGDTGLNIIDCRFVTVTNCIFSELRDIGIYYTGDSSFSKDGDGGDIVISQSHFYKCSGGIASKRQSQRALITDNVFHSCHRGITIVATDPLLDPPSGRRAIIANNSFAYTAKNPILLQYGEDGGTIITGNRIQDFGYELDGVTPINGFGIAILLEGTSNNFITGNWIGMQDWEPHSACYGVALQGYTYDSTVRMSQHNIISNNHFISIDTGYLEMPGAAKFNTYKNNTFKSVTSNYRNIDTTSQSLEHETGSWDVRIYDALSGGNVSPTIGAGTYIKIGKLVMLSFAITAIDTTGMNPSGLLSIALPFRARADVGASGSVVTKSIVFPASRNSPVLTVSAASARAYIATTGTGVAAQAILISGITSGQSDITQATLVYESQ